MSVTAQENSFILASRWILAALVLVALVAFSVRGLMGLAQQSSGTGSSTGGADELVAAHKELSDELNLLPGASDPKAGSALGEFCGLYRRRGPAFAKSSQQLPVIEGRVRRAADQLSAACRLESRLPEFHAIAQQALLDMDSALSESRRLISEARGRDRFLALVEWLALLAVSLSGLFYLAWRRWEASVVLLPTAAPQPLIVTPAENPPDQSMRAVIETSTEGIIMVEPDGRIRSANAAAERLLGYGRGELAGLEAERIAPGLMSAQDPQGIWEQCAARNREGGEIQRRISWFRRTGAPTVVFVAPVRNSASSQPRQSAQQFAPVPPPEFDAASLRQLENEILLINGYGEVALSNLPPDDPMRPDIEQLTRAAARASLLCREAATSPSAPVELSPVRLNSFIAGFERHLCATLEPGIEVEVRADALSGTVSANAGLLEQALLSLLMHALPSVGEPRLIRLSTMPGRIEASVRTRGAVNLGWRRTFEERRLPRAAAWLAAQGAMLEEDVAEGGAGNGYRFRIRPISLTQTPPVLIARPARIDVAS